MAITKTDFINFSRCPRYVALENIHKDRLDADISYEDYNNQELKSKINEMIGMMIEETVEGEEIDLIDKINPQLEAMMDYYKKVEELAYIQITKQFGGETKYAYLTRNQECFDFSRNGFRYLCYIDIYNENDSGINIIEVKATTSNKYIKLESNHRKGDKYSIFKDIDNIKYLKDEIKGYDITKEMPLDKYEEKKNKLFDRFSKEGKYVYDLAVQRFIIENEYKESHNEEKLKKIKYYLAVLNHEYIYNGKKEEDLNIYDMDENGNEIITLFDMTEITDKYQKEIEKDANRIEEYLKNMESKPCLLGPYCERKNQTECKYFNKICGSMIPKKNSSLNYMHNPMGFKTDNGDTLKGLNLINEGYINMLDIPASWIKSRTHELQRECLEFNRAYINKEKIIDMLNQIKYPIYHLDFETFPCPIPRFKGEKPYTQSPFEFSLHIEKEPGNCDKDKDNYVFLADSTNDVREELIKKMLEYMDPDKGTLLAQNVSFEKSRIRELASIFPQYKMPLMKLYDRGFDLLWIVNTNTEIYKSLGYSEEDAKLFNYYHPDLSGSYSIKKTLPIFSNLSYENLDIKNGTEAIVIYANYNKMSKEEFKIKYNSLIDYCKQDTWAMVEILNALRNLVK